MSTGDVLVSWASRTAPTKVGAELLPMASGDRSLELALTDVASNLGNARFLIVNVSKIDATTVSRAIGAFHAAGGNTRLCLAGDRETLTQVDAAGFDSDRVGLMLDDVGPNTTCSDLIWDRLEAIRFDPEFVARATRDVRTACALESMLGLAREIGLRTLGTDGSPEGAGVFGRCDFNYQPAPAHSASIAPPGAPVPRRGHRGATATFSR
jgi:hypothetical protein